MADVNLVAPHSDGDYWHGAEARNLWLSVNGAGVIGDEVIASLTGADRVITIPAFSARVPDGNGGNVLVEYSGGTVTADAGDSTDPRYDAIVIDKDGVVALHTGTPTATDTDMPEPPVPPLNSDEILLGIVFVEANASTISASDVKGRAYNVASGGGGGGGGLTGVEVFTSNGSFDVSQVPVSPDGGQWVEVEVQAGGGGGSGATSGFHGTGGGGGGYARKRINLAGAASVAVTVGSGGNGGSGTGNGSKGGDSSFGTYVSATGGDAGLNGGLASAGGVGVNGDVNIPGGTGTLGWRIQTSRATEWHGFGGVGGNSFMGHGGVGLWTGDTARAGTPGSGYGGGGSGVARMGSGSVSGGAGAPGIVIVRW